MNLNSICLLYIKTDIAKSSNMYTDRLLDHKNRIYELIYTFNQSISL